MFKIKNIPVPIKRRKYNLVNEEEKIIILVKDFYIGNFYRSLGFSIFNKIDSISEPVLKFIKNRNT